jgi:hypothetical protein
MAEWRQQHIDTSLVDAWMLDMSGGSLIFGVWFIPLFLHCGGIDLY